MAFWLAALVGAVGVVDAAIVVVYAFFLFSNINERKL